jgi:saccharopine dehydrogenase-like NADP-dependent oxidoreductase
MAGSGGAQYMENGRIKIVPYHEALHHTWPVDVDGMGELIESVRIPNLADRSCREVVESETPGLAAMSKAVGLPAAIAVKPILRGELPLTGSFIPTHRAIYEPVLRELHDNGLFANEKTTPLL